MKEKKEIQVQLSPFGEFPQTREDGTQVVQICDEQAFQGLLENFGGGEIPVDFDHGIESDGGSTRAGAWVERMWVDPEKGLMASLALTPAGEEAVQGREYRYLSPAWILGKDGRPEKLVSVGFTNRPNLPVAPVANSRRVAHAIFNGQSASVTGGQPSKDKPNMNELKQALGLEETADDAAILEAVKALVAEIGQLRRAKAEAEMDAEAEEFANALNPADAEQKENIKNAYKVSPQAAKMLAKNIRAAAPQRVYNTAAAKVPELPRKGIDARAEMASLPTRERAAFYAAHRAEIDG